jgi:hypothetical protein
VIVLRRRLQRAEKELTGGTERLLLEAAPPDPYEYVPLVTNADWNLAGLAQLYRERADISCAQLNATLTSLTVSAPKNFSAFHRIPTATSIHPTPKKKSYGNM